MKKLFKGWNPQQALTALTVATQLHHHQLVMPYLPSFLFHPPQIPTTTITTYNLRMRVIKEFYKTSDMNDNYLGAVRTRDIAAIAESLHTYIKDPFQPELQLCTRISDVAYFLVTLATLQRENLPTTCFRNGLTLHELWVPIERAQAFLKRYWRKWELTRRLKSKRYTREMKNLCRTIELTFEKFTWPISFDDTFVYDKEDPISLTIKKAVDWACRRQEYLDTSIVQASPTNLGRQAPPPQDARAPPVHVQRQRTIAAYVDSGENQYIVSSGVQRIDINSGRGVSMHRTYIMPTP